MPDASKQTVRGGAQVPWGHLALAGQAFAAGSSKYRIPPISLSTRESVHKFSNELTSLTPFDLYGAMVAADALSQERRRLAAATT